METVKQRIARLQAEIDELKSLTPDDDYVSAEQQRLMDEDDERCAFNDELDVYLFER